MQSTHKDKTLDLSSQQNNEFDCIDDGYHSSIYSQSRILDFKEYIQKKDRFRNNKRHWAQIPRANDPTKPIHEKADNILDVVVYKLRKYNVAILNQNYLTRITKCRADQNANLLKQLANVLYIQFHRKIIIDSVTYRNVYVFRHTKEGRAIIENSAVLLAQRHFVGKMLVNPVVSGSSKKCLTEKIRPSSIYKEEVFENNRSIKSNFLQNSNSSIQTELVDVVEEQKEIAEENFVVKKTYVEETTVKIRSLKKRKENQRKKPTNSSIKAKIIKLVSYSKPKSLGEMHQLLDQGMYDELRSKSGREFSNNFIAQKVLAMSKNPAITASFRYKAGFISYMSLALRYELHDTVKTSGESFRLRVNMTEEDRQDGEVEKFLTGIEQEAIRHVCPENQLKAKLANALEKTKAYQLLSKLKEFKVCGDTAQIHLNRVLSLTEREKALILSQVQATYETVDFNGNYQAIEHLEFVVEKSADDLCLEKSSNSNIQGSNLGSNRSEPLKLPKGVWGDVLQKLITEYGIDTYKHWFSKLTATVDVVEKTIELKASSSMIQEWIDNNYGESLARIFVSMNMRFNGIQKQI